MVKITDEMAEFIKRVRLCFVATVSPDGLPNVSPKGSLMRSGPSSIAFAHIRSPDTIANVQHNPAVEISVISPLSRKGYLFAGRAKVIREGAEFDRLAKEFAESGIKNSVEAAVVIDVERIEETTSPLYDLGYEEKQIIQMWQDRIL